MTEDEAKTKWCPHAVASHTDPRQRVEDRFLHHCIGSACMAWRAEHHTRGPIVERRSVKDSPRRPEGDDWGYEGGVHPCTPGASQDAQWVRWDGFIVHGFCGLAGGPA